LAFHTRQLYRPHPQVRPFVLAAGRTRARTRHPLLVHTIVSAEAYDRRVAAALTRQERAVYECTYAAGADGVSVAEVSAHTGLALGLVRVILGDLLDWDAITVHSTGFSPWEPAPVTRSLLERVIRGLQQL
jgi:hypothetical protein